VGLAGFAAGAGVLFGGEFNDEDDDEDFGFFSCVDAMVGSARKSRIKTNGRRYFGQDAELGFMSFSSSDLAFRRTSNFCSSRLSAHLRVLKTLERPIAHSVTAPADGAFFRRFSQVAVRGLPVSNRDSRKYDSQIKEGGAGAAGSQITGRREPSADSNSIRRSQSK
jgi:hypothetical protein